MKKFNVEGMTCSACSARVENAVSKLDGVTECSVNLLTKSMTVYGNFETEKIISAVYNAGYTASVLDKNEKQTVQKTSDKRVQNKLNGRLVWSLIFTLLLMYFSMGWKMFNLPFIRYWSNPFALAIIQMLLSILVLFINKSFFVSGFRAVIHKSPNMDTLVSMGSGVSFVYSVCTLLAMSHYFFVGDKLKIEELFSNLYFDSAAMILTLILIGKTLEEYSKGKTTNAISALVALTPKTAIRVSNGVEQEISAEELRAGDIFAVKPGAHIPADAIVTDGSGAVDESALTGESIPVDKNKGDAVSSGTVNLSGYLLCKTTKVGEDTTLSKIIEMVKEASSTKAPIAKLANKVSGIFVPTVITISILTFIIHILLGTAISYALKCAISVLVVSCPCALGLATPVAIMVGNGVGAKCGILYKTAAALEEAGRIKTVVLDKTGTVTNGTPDVTEVFSFEKERLLSVAASLECKSEHPIAKAVNKYAKSLNVKILKTENFEIFSGNGLLAKEGSNILYGGNLQFVLRFAKVGDEFIQKAEEFAKSGNTPLLFGENEKILGIIAVADTLKRSAVQAVSELYSMGLSVVMLTGDNERTAKAIAKKAGIETVIAEVLPDGKQREIEKLKKNGKVLMVGDGINDAPALTSANVGMAIGAGTDIAIDAADIVLVKNDLNDVCAAIKLGRKTLQNIKQNLFWAFCYNIIGIPLAAGAFSAFGFSLNPMFSAAAMSISSFIVVTNSLRLNFSKLYVKKEKKNMEKIEKIIGVEGMMCPHCEARVKEALEKTEGVLEALPSHAEKRVKLVLSKNIDDEILAKIITDMGYKVI